jgi:hypothetical protein
MSIVATVGPQNEPLDVGAAQREVLALLKERDALKNRSATRAAEALEGGGAELARPTVLSFFRTLKEQQKCEQTHGAEAGGSCKAEAEARRDDNEGEGREADGRDSDGIEEQTSPSTRIYTYADV